MSKADRDNRSNQLNPNNDAYSQSRGYRDRDEDCEDDDSGRTWWSQIYSPPPPQPSAFDEHVECVREDVARNMTSTRAGEILVAHIGNVFPAIVLTNASSGTDLWIEVRGCAIDSRIADQLMAIVNNWLRTRSWMIAHCVERTELLFHE